MSLDDCTEHMSAGGKKYAPQIFYFDGASNVQKADHTLEAKYPRTMCLHGAEHVGALMFSDLAKLGPIKVSTM